MKKIVNTCFTLIALLITLRCFPQAPGYKNFRLEKDNKLIQLNSIFKDKQGYLFAGTDDGLYKFDGDKYMKIHFENNDQPDTVTAIFQDKKEKMWIGFKSGKIANIINKKLAFIDPEEALPKKKITAFLEDMENNIWFSTNGEGIYYFRNNKLYLVNEEDGLSDLNISCLVLAANGDVLAGSDQGINVCHIDNGQKKIRLIGPQNGLPDYIVTSITPAGHDRYWIGLQDKGFCLYDHLQHNIFVPSLAKGWESGQVNSLLQVENVLWLATENYGLCRYDIRADKCFKIPGTILSGHNNNLLQDNQGNIWLSSPEYGMIKTPGETLKLMPVPGSPVFEHVHVILCDKAGNTWLNNEWNDLIRVDQSKQEVVATKIRLTGLNEKTDITSLYLDTNGNIWVGTMGRGIFIVNPITFAYRSFTENMDFINASILSISGSGDKVYVSSLQGSMQINITATKDINNRYEYSNFDSKQTGTNYIYSIFKDSRNRIWFATDGRGLTMLQNSIFTYYDKQQLADDRIYSITEDKKNNIWFSTADEGIYKFDGKTFTNYGLNQGLTDVNISVLKTDKAGNIIIVHKKGLDILDPVTGNVSYISASHGIATVNAEDLGAVATDTAGNVMVSTRDGILTYTAPQHVINKPTALIESVQLFLMEIPETRQHVFDHDENNFTFNYTGLYYSSPEKVYYKYKLEGLDSNWIITTDRSKNFPKLAHGKYVFHIQAALNKNFSNASEASYSFTIRQAFYKTPWFIGSCALLFMLLLYWYIRNREATLKKNERLQQEKIQFQFEVLRNQVNPHFLFNSFNTLISTIEDEPKQAAEYAAHLSDFFRNIVNQRDKDTISLKEEISSLLSYIFLQQKRYGEHFKININLTEEQQLKTNIPPLTLQLLVENAIKHNIVSKETALLVNISIDANHFLTVRNNCNPRISKQEGAGLGLQNIINRYRLLSNKPVTVSNDGKYFIVSLPLLN
jgi:ligand-binding sensor domain-containing protein